MSVAASTAAMHEMELCRRRIAARRAGTAAPPFPLSFSSDSLPSAVAVVVRAEKAVIWMKKVAEGLGERRAPGGHPRWSVSSLSRVAPAPLSLPATRSGTGRPGELSLSRSPPGRSVPPPPTSRTSSASIAR